MAWTNNLLLQEYRTFVKISTMRIRLLILLLSLPAFGQAQVFMRAFDNSTAMALGSAVIAYPGLGAGLGNDAAPGFGEKAALFLGGALPYNIGGWQAAHFQGIMRAGANDGVGLEFTHSAIETYGEQQFRLVYGRRLGNKFLLGGSANVHRISAQEYGNATGFTFGLSVLAEALPGVWLGARVQNPLQQEMAGTALPSVLRIGAAWQAASTLILLAETEKDLDRPAQIKAGIEYHPVEALALRMGIRTEPARLGFGAGFQLKNGLEFDTGAEWHPTLGFTPSAMVVWRKR